MAENLAILESQLLWELWKCSSKPDIKMSLWSFSSLSPPPSNMHLSDDSPFLIKSEPSFPKQQDTGVGIRAACLVLFSNFVKTSSNLQCVYNHMTRVPGCVFDSWGLTPVFVILLKSEMYKILISISNGMLHQLYQRILLTLILKNYVCLCFQIIFIYRLSLLLYPTNLKEPAHFQSVSMFSVSQNLNYLQSLALSFSHIITLCTHCNLTLSQSEWFLRQTLRSQCRYTTE